jgi:hypothetical protein
MPRQIKLMADYQSYPLWWVAGDDTGNIDPSKLPISPRILERLDEWARLYDETLNSSDPLSSGFINNQDEMAFEQEGIDLWRHIQAELSPEYEVFFYSRRRRKLIRNDEDLQ